MIKPRARVFMYIISEDAKRAWMHTRQGVARPPAWVGAHCRYGSVDAFTWDEAAALVEAIRARREEIEAQRAVVRERALTQKRAQRRTAAK